ncbi:MAG: hypothetical protein BWY96_01158 [Spirochaetes bacterium ADurb.BinA120]|nr:MAG: hypothetical protein BWY96_01158 [Spirochaetes bacterium ADurb.BinA120]
MASLAWMHLWGLSKAIEKSGMDPAALPIEAEGDSGKSFFVGRALASRFYLGVEFPLFFGKVDSVLANERAVVDCAPEFYSGS